MTTNLPPLDWRPIAFIPYGDATELPTELGWSLWDEAVREMDELVVQGRGDGVVEGR